MSTVSLALTLKLMSLALALRLKSLVLTLICYGGPDTIDWSYILPHDGRLIHIPTNNKECCPCPWFLVALKDKIVVVGHGLGLDDQVLVIVNILANS